MVWILTKGRITLNTGWIQTGKRYLILMLGLAIMAFGVAFSIKANLGTSPISSVPYAVSLFSPLTVGTATIVMHCVFILIQILILRKRYEWIQLMQLPVAFFFGYLTDFAVLGPAGSELSAYWQQWIVCLIGILLVAVGVSLEVKANVVVLAGEGVVLAICKVVPVKFGYMKVGFDVTLVLVAWSAFSDFYRPSSGSQRRDGGGRDSRWAFGEADREAVGGCQSPLT